MKPFLSIITVCLNDKVGFARTRDSVFEQTETDFEWIIVDGWSSDGSLEAIREIEDARILYTSEPDAGIYDAMNKGMGMARGEWVWFMNAGDTFFAADTVTKVRSVSAGYDIVFGEAEVFSKGGEILGLRSETLPHQVPLRPKKMDFRFGMLISHQAFVVRRSIAPLFNLSYKWGADFDWMLRIFEKTTRAKRLNVLARVQREGATTENWRASMRERFAIMRIHFGLAHTCAAHVFIVARRFFWSIRSSR